ncbi:hypothetical protein PQQ96_23935 [Paraburkholderia sediminicola]|uniref:hypothetical protein n=1 Tax=Paraburkholderia sediminicola TaxID=458836 RepID=UPI0038BCAF1C
MKGISLVSLFSVALVLNAFLMRPAALGQEYVSVAMVLSVVLVGAYLAARGRAPRTILSSGRRDILFVTCLVIIYWLYELPLGIAQAGDDVLVAKDFISSIVVTVCYAVFLMEERANKAFFRIFATVVALLGWSSIVTLILSSIVGLDHLFLFPIRVKGYEQTAVTGGGMTTGGVYFPFSMLYSVYTTGQLQLNRYSNFFREAGIYQAVSIFCFAYERYTRRSKFMTFGLIAGAMSSLSTLGLVLLPLTAGLVYVTRRKVNILRVAALGIFTVVAVTALLFMPAVGIADKLDSHGTSITDRSEAISRGVGSIWTYPLGRGLFNDRAFGDSVCLLAAIAGIGLPGFLIQLALLSGARPGSKFVNPKVVACFPLLVTAVFSQPIAGSGMTYILVMVATPASLRRRSGESIRPQRELQYGDARAVAIR